jgi:hypothetical protein
MLEIQVKINYILQQFIATGKIKSIEGQQKDVEIDITYQETNPESTIMRITLSKDEWDKELKAVYDVGFEDGYEQGIINLSK